MNLPISLDYPPMDAESARALPHGPYWQYEPKWDGFRCLAFKDENMIELQSKSGQPLSRYFPELVEVLQGLKPKRFVLDGEIVVPEAKSLSFDLLLQRIHPAASRIRKLSQETPAELVVFDLLVDEKVQSLIGQPLTARRAALEDFAARYLKTSPTLHLSPATSDLDEARAWLANLHGGLDGIVAKKTDIPYQSGNREGMLKIKNLRSADCVIGGFRYASKGSVVGSLLLGLYDDEGKLHHVGFTSGLSAAEKPEITQKLEALREPPGFTGQAPGGPSRWSTERSTVWEPLANKLVVEVQYDHFAGGRFRHGTRLLRWRPDKAASQCTLKQVERESVSPLNLLGAI